jgi:3'-5' exoribonuclease
MKRQFVEALQEGDRVDDYFVATRKDLRDQQNGSKFLGMVFKDRTGDIGGVMWNNAAGVAQMFELGDVVNVRGTVNSYQNRLQIRVEQVLPMRGEEYDEGDLVFTPDDTEAVENGFKSVMATIKNEWLRKLTDSFLQDEDFMARFTVAAAGKRWHHAYRGGLIEHCYEMARIAETMADLFPQIDRDVLLTGVLVHDIGKLDEMTQDLAVDYTTEGKLIGHLQIGMLMVQRKIDAIPEFPEDLRLQVLHLVLSHHGEQENGSPVVPKTLEGMVLYQIDNLDAQTNAFTRIIEETKSKGQEWSEYIGLIDRQVWAKPSSS